MDAENVHSCHSDQSLSELLQIAIEADKRCPVTYAILQRLLDYFPNSADLSVNYDLVPNSYDLQ